MRISFVLDTFGGGGKERRCLQLIQGLNKKGYNDIQVIIVNDKVDYQELYETSAEVIIINRKGRGLSTFATYLQLKKLLRAFKPDVVQVWGLMAVFFVNLIRLTNKFKYYGAYVADCNKPTGISVLSNKICCLLADKIIGNSYAGLNAYGIPRRKQVCIYNGYNKKRLRLLDEEAKRRKREELGIRTPFVVVMAASVYPAKDYETYLKVAYCIRKERNDVTFLALGKGPQLEYYMNLAEGKYKNSVNFLGFRSDVDEIIEICTLSCLFSSPIHEEGVSNSILESMVHGVPVVATDAGGTPEIIEEGKNGFLIKDNDVVQAVQRIKLLLDDKKLHTLFVQKARQTVDKDFNLEDKTVEYLRLYTCS